jgi:hypothetical protein
MTKPSDTLWKLEPHTAAKHRILRSYLNAWLPILSKYNSRLVLIDGFAGPGEYEGGEPGSPLIMLDAFLSHAYKDLISARRMSLRSSGRSRGDTSSQPVTGFQVASVHSIALRSDIRSLFNLSRANPAK